MDYFAVTASTPLRHSTCTVVILLTAYLTVLVAGLVGNVLVIVIVAKLPKMKTAINYFIVNLAIADLLVLIVCLSPGLISNIYVPWVMGSLMCKVVPYVQGVAVCASVYSLAAISGERLMAIWFPLRRQITKSVARRIIIWIWIMAAGLAFPWLLYFDLANADRSEPSMVFCIENWPSGMNGNIYFGLVNLGLFYLFPLSFISFCHFSIWFRVRHRNVPTDSSMSQMDLVHQRTNARVQKIVTVIVVGFAASWLPLYVIFVRIKLIPAMLGAMEEQVLDYALPIAQWLGASNSCVNPILYLFFNRNFRFALRRLLRGDSACRAPKSRPSPHNHLNQDSGCRTNVARLSVALERYHPKQSQLSNSRGNAMDPEESKLVMLHQKNRKLGALSRSHTY